MLCLNIFLYLPGINIMHNEMFTIENGDRPDVQNIALVITDDKSMVNSEKTVFESDKAKAKGIHMIAVGVGNQV